MTERHDDAVIWWGDNVLNIEDKDEAEND